MSELFREKKLLSQEYFQNVENLKGVKSQDSVLGSLQDKPEEEEKEIEGKVLGEEALAGKVVALYFSAGWCPPCQQFTPLLRDFYDEALNRGHSFQIVFISCDKRLDDMSKYFMEKHGDWLALDFEDPIAEELKTKYNITAIPKLVVIHKDGSVVTAKGRKEIQDKGIICFRNWQQAIITMENKTAQAAEENSETKDGEKTDTAAVTEVKKKEESQHIVTIIEN